MSVDFIAETAISDWKVETMCSECDKQDASLYDIAHSSYLCKECFVLNHDNCKLKLIEGVYLVPKLFNKLAGNYNKARAYMESNYNRHISKSFTKFFDDIKGKLISISEKLSKPIQKRSVRETITIGEEISQLKYELETTKNPYNKVIVDYFEKVKNNPDEEKKEEIKSLEVSSKQSSKTLEVVQKENAKLTDECRELKSQVDECKQKIQNLETKLESKNNAENKGSRESSSKSQIKLFNGKLNTYILECSEKYKQAQLKHILQDVYGDDYNEEIDEKYQLKFDLNVKEDAEILK